MAGKAGYMPASASMIRPMATMCACGETSPEFIVLTE